VKLDAGAGPLFLASTFEPVMAAVGLGSVLGFVAPLKPGRRVKGASPATGLSSVVVESTTTDAWW
jgi:hypothetical protein